MRNKQYWIDRAERRMDGYVASAFDEARVIGRAYRGIKNYITAEMAKILRHIGDEDSLAYEYRMKRLNALLLNAEKKYKEAYGISLNSATEFLKSIIPEAYYHTIFDIAQGFGVQPEFATIPTKLVNKIINEDWSGKNYSKRIWANTDKLAEELREVLTEAAVSGESIYKTSRKVAEKFDTASYNAERLIRTETTYATNQAEMLAYDELDIDEYEYVATLDTRTSSICQKLDGKIFKTKDAQAGKNLPAMHPNCRSTTIPHFKEGNPTMRTARDKDGKRITVPASMKYPEWYDKYIKPTEGEKSPQKPSNPSKGKDTAPSKPTPQQTPESVPATVDVPAPEVNNPEYKDTPISPKINKKPLDIDNSNAIIEEKEHKTAAKEQLPPDFSKYDIKEDLEAVEKAKQFIIDELGVPADMVNLDGIKNAEVLDTFVKRMKTIQKKNSFKIPQILANDVIKGDENCVSLYNQKEGILYISSKYFNSKEALLDAFEDWRNSSYMPKQMKNVVYLAEHEAAHIYIPDSLLEKQEAKEIWSARKLLNENDEDIYEYFADATAIYRMNPHTDDGNIIEAMNYLRKGGVIV